MPRPDKVVRYALFASLLSSFVFLSCCAPAGPAKGSPEWLFSAAREEFKSGGILKAQESLEKLEEMEGNPYQARAVAWDLLIKGGRLMGYEEIASAYQDGFPNARDNKINFTREKEAQLTELRGSALHYLETAQHFDKIVKGDTVTLEFPFPDGSGAPVVDLERIQKGQWPTDEARSALYDKIMLRDMLRGLSIGITTADDVPGAQKAMASGTATVPMSHFLLAIADTTSRCATFYNEHYLSETDKRKMFLQRTIDMVKRIHDMKPDPAVDKDAKKLQDAAEKELKKIKS